MQACFAYSIVDLPLKGKHGPSYNLVYLPLNLPYQSLLSSKIRVYSTSKLGFLTV